MQASCSRGKWDSIFLAVVSLPANAIIMILMQIRGHYDPDWCAVSVLQQSNPNTVLAKI
jgi:hypothetical protein